MAYLKGIFLGILSFIYVTQVDVTPVPPLAPCTGCNVILISMDTLRADHLGSGRTPNLDRIAQRSLVFSEAFANAFYTTPSHMTLFTSLYPLTHQVEARNFKVPHSERTALKQQPLGANFQTLAEVFRANGYDTAWAGPRRLKHLDFSLGFARGFRLQEETVFHRRMDELVGGGGFQREAFGKLLNLKTPFFLFLHSYVTHLPFRDDSIEGTRIHYEGERLLNGFAAAVRMNFARTLGLFDDADSTSTWPAEAVSACGQRTQIAKCWDYTGREKYWTALGQWQQRESGELFRGEFAERERAAAAQAYAKQVSYLDGQIGEMWNNLEEKGLLQSTIVVFVSDHGEELGEHGYMSHSTFHEHSIRVPMMIWHPKLDAGTRVNILASLVDVMPTVLAMAGLPAPDQVQGVDLAKVKADDDRAVFGEALGNEYVRTRDWKWMRDYRGEEKLFNLRVDPLEKQNLIDVPLPWVRKAYRDLRRRAEYWKLGQGI